MNPNAKTPIADWTRILLLESFNGKRAFFDLVKFSDKSFFLANVGGFTYGLLPFLLEIKQEIVLQQTSLLSVMNIFLS